MEEERVVYKKKGGFIGKLITFLLASILGIIAGIGGLTLSFGKVTITSIACALILGIIVNLILSKADKK